MHFGLQGRIWRNKVAMQTVTLVKLKPRWLENEIQTEPSALHRFSLGATRLNVS